MEYLILDKATSHVTAFSRYNPAAFPQIISTKCIIFNTYRNSDNFLSFIPADLTRYLQSLDVVVNKPFKEAIKKLYVEYCLKNGGDKRLDMITKVWWDQNIISKEIIYKSFQITGIANSLKGEENYLFSTWG